MTSPATSTGLSQYVASAKILVPGVSSPTVTRCPSTSPPLEKSGSSGGSAAAGRTRTRRSPRTLTSAAGLLLGAIHLPQVLLSVGEEGLETPLCLHLLHPFVLPI